MPKHQERGKRSVEARYQVTATAGLRNEVIPHAFFSQETPRTNARVKAVFFDFDGVLTTDKSGSLTTSRYLSQHTGIPSELIERALKAHSEALNTGKTTHAAIWPEVCERVGVDIPLNLLSAAFASTPINIGMLRLARKLKEHHVVGIITDNRRDRFDCLRELHALDSLFDPIVVSAECGYTKSDTAIFEHALQRAQLPAPECVFIDNSPANLTVAEGLGMHAIYFDDARNDIEELVQHLRKHMRVQIEPARR